MISKKQYLKSKPQVKVTLELTAEQVQNAETVNVVGDFSNWDVNANPMKKAKDGSFKITLDLASEQEHQFRYYINNAYWANESEADKYVPTGVSYEENSVIVL